MKISHQRQYEMERKIRWRMASQNEESVMQTIESTLATTYPEIDARRYDKPWFDLLTPKELDCWVRGVSDYAVKLENGKGFFAEIKIKQKFFRKTKTGGTTKSGSNISNYGCESVYLDVSPVFENVTKFLGIFGIPASSFVFLFSHIGQKEIYAISVEEINHLLDFGYNGQKICEFGEGYGIRTKEGRAKCYLLPVDAMHILGKEDRSYFDTHYTDKIVFPNNLLDSETKTKR